MTKLPNTETMTVWSKLIRVEQDLMADIETRLKAADLPPLRWYDVLLELAREGAAGLRPKVLEDRLLLSQYNISRLIDRMAKVGLVRIQRLKEDKRAQRIELTAQGQETKERIWQIYGPFIEARMGEKLSPTETSQLINLLDKLRDS